MHMNMNEDDGEDDDEDLQLLCNSCESESDKVRIENNSTVQHSTCQNRTDQMNVKY